MHPAKLKTKIFLDGGDPNETRQAIDLLGFLDGQTTNPTLISKNPQVIGEKFPKEKLLEFYKSILQEIFQLIPEGSISIEVYAGKNTTHQEMFEQGRKMFTWIPNAHIKFPTNTEGLKAAQQAVDLGLRVNMTLTFSQEQAAAVYAATKPFPNVFVSPFAGRLDDKGENGMDLIKNIIQMFKNSDHHVAVLTASVRNLNHLLYALSLGSDIITAPFNILKEWAENGLPIPGAEFVYDPGNLTSIPYQKLDLNQDWHKFNIAHELTDSGIEKFANDWNTLII